MVKHSGEEKLDEEEEDSELEEVLEEDELEEIVEDLDEDPDKIISSEDFQEFIQSRGGSPVLEQVAEGTSMAPVGRMQNQELSGAIGNGGGAFEYIAGSSSSEEGEDTKKYIQSTMDETMVEQANIFQSGREGTFSQNMQQIGMMQSEQRGPENLGQEKYKHVERANIDSAGKEEIFNKELKKYEPKLPR